MSSTLYTTSQVVFIVLVVSWHTCITMSNDLGLSFFYSNILENFIVGSLCFFDFGFDALTLIFFYSLVPPLLYSLSSLLHLLLLLLCLSHAS